MSDIVLLSGKSACTPLPKVVGVHPAASKILVECLKADEVLGTNLHISESANVGGAPQALIIELGPRVSEDAGLKVGQRVYWNGNGIPVEDPRAEHGRVRALLEISNVIAIIEEAH